MAERNWSSRSIGSKLQHAIFRVFIRVGGYPAAYCLLFWVVLWYTLLPSVRKRSAPYRNRMFPEDTGLKQWVHCMRLHRELGKVLVDRAVTGISGKFSVRSSVEEGDLIKNLHAEGKGLILLTAHIGYWQMAARCLHEYVASPVNILLHRDEGDNDKHFFEYGANDYGIRIIDPKDGPASAVMLLQALQRGEVVALMGDRTYGNDAHTVKAQFLGGEVPLPYSAYRLAASSGAPVVITFAFRERPGAARHEIAAVIRVPENSGRGGKTYFSYAEQFASSMEDAVHKEPYQFFNFYDMWEQTR